MDWHYWAKFDRGRMVSIDTIGGRILCQRCHFRLVLNKSQNPEITGLLCELNIKHLRFNWDLSCFYVFLPKHPVHYTFNAKIGCKISLTWKWEMLWICWHRISLKIIWIIMIEWKWLKLKFWRKCPKALIVDNESAFS